MHVRCLGSGPSTVLLIAGFTADHTTFAGIEPEVSRTSRVRSYDKFGTGTSEPPRTPQTSAEPCGRGSSPTEPEPVPGRYVALDLVTDAVLADAATMIEIIEIVHSRGLKDSIVRTPREDETILVGLG